MLDEKKIEEAAEDIFEDKFLGNGEEIIFTNDEGCEDYREEMYYDGQIKERYMFQQKRKLLKLRKR